MSILDDLRNRGLIETVSTDRARADQWLEDANMSRQRAI